MQPNRSFFHPHQIADAGTWSCILGKARLRGGGEDKEVFVTSVAQPIIGVTRVMAFKSLELRDLPCPKL